MCVAGGWSSCLWVGVLGGPTRGVAVAVVAVVMLHAGGPPSDRERVLNVISLEFSDTQLAPLVCSPKVVRDIDWIDNVRACVAPLGLLLHPPPHAAARTVAPCAARPHSHNCHTSARSRPWPRRTHCPISPSARAVLRFGLRVADKRSSTRRCVSAEPGQALATATAATCTRLTPCPLLVLLFVVPCFVTC